MGQRTGGRVRGVQLEESGPQSKHEGSTEYFKGCFMEISGHIPKMLRVACVTR